MNRRRLITAILISLGSSVAGCISTDERLGMRDTGGNNENDNLDRNLMNTDDHGEFLFELLGYEFEFEESASITIVDRRIRVIGIIQGNNTCYSARVNELTINAGGVIIDIESYEEKSEDDGCYDAEIGIQYKLIIELEERPSSVTVTHNNRVIATK